MNKNDIIKLTITDINPDGYGVGKLDGYVFFVRGTAPGDVIEAKILKLTKSYGYAKTERTVIESEHRAEIGCDTYFSCGGCAFRHIEYAEELKIKQKLVNENFERIGGLFIKSSAVFPSPRVDGYRNKAIFRPVLTGNGVSFGFYAPRSHRVVPCESCALHPEFYMTIARIVGKWCDEYGISLYDEETARGLLRALFIRDGRKSSEALVCLACSEKSIPHADVLAKRLITAVPRIKSVVLNVNPSKGNVILGKECITLYGKGSVSDTLCNLNFEISPLSFYQVNRDGAEILYTRAYELLSPGADSLLLDLYCGTGTIGLSMARGVKRLIGVEIVPEAIENAKNNAVNNGIDNAEFICADAGTAARDLLARGVKPDAIVVDPPRSGMDAAAINAILALSPEKLLMISCDSATAARDARALCQGGYTPRILENVDMFPRTGHIESILLMSKTDR